MVGHRHTGPTLPDFDASLDRLRCHGHRTGRRYRWDRAIRPSSAIGHCRARSRRSRCHHWGALHRELLGGWRSSCTRRLVLARSCARVGMRTNIVPCWRRGRCSATGAADCSSCTARSRRCLASSGFAPTRGRLFLALVARGERLHFGMLRVSRHRMSRRRLRVSRLSMSRLSRSRRRRSRLSDGRIRRGLRGRSTHDGRNAADNGRRAGRQARWRSGRRRIGGPGRRRSSASRGYGRFFSHSFIRATSAYDTTLRALRWRASRGCSSHTRTSLG